MSRIRQFLARHPLVREALVWALPALAVGLALRALLMYYLPYAYWGSDSRSYYGFTEQLLDKGEFSLYDKRRYLYLLLMLPVTVLPGAMLKWLALLQHAMGLATLIPLAYTVRKAFAGWKLWIVPVTVLYAGLPILLWYEHEMLAEALFFHAFVWLIAGWMAFAPARGAAVAARFWWFFGGLAVIVLTKPAGRFLWPAVVLGLLATVAWKVLDRRHWIALTVLLGVTFTIGQDSQSAWLLYSSGFPLTRLDTPLHAEYKAEVAPLVQAARKELETSSRALDATNWNDFLKYPERHPEHPLWHAMDETKRQKVCKDLAKEGILSHPFLFMKIALGKIIASANPGEFRSDRFLPDYTIEKYGKQYERDAKDKPKRIQRLFGLSSKEPLPAFAEFQHRLAPHPDFAGAQWLRGYVDRYQSAARMVEGDDEDRTTVVLTPLAWWVLIGCALAFLPPFFRPMGWPVVVGLGYLCGTFLVGGTNPRYFGAVWAVVLLAMVVPLDLLYRLIVQRRAKL